MSPEEAIALFEAYVEAGSDVVTVPYGAEEGIGELLAKLEEKGRLDRETLDIVSQVTPADLLGNRDKESEPLGDTLMVVLGGSKLKDDEIDMVIDQAEALVESGSVKRYGVAGLDLGKSQGDDPTTVTLERVWASAERKARRGGTPSMSVVQCPINPLELEALEQGLVGRAADRGLAVYADHAIVSSPRYDADPAMFTTRTWRGSEAAVLKKGVRLKDFGSPGTENKRNSPGGGGTLTIGESYTDEDGDLSHLERVKDVSDYDKLLSERFNTAIGFEMMYVEMIEKLRKNPTREIPEEVSSPDDSEATDSDGAEKSKGSADGKTSSQKKKIKDVSHWLDELPEPSEVSWAQILFSNHDQLENPCKWEHAKRGTIKPQLTETAKMLQGKDEFHLWGHKYARSLVQLMDTFGNVAHASELKKSTQLVEWICSHPIITSLPSESRMFNPGVTDLENLIVVLLRCTGVDCVVTDSINVLLEMPTADEPQQPLSAEQALEVLKGAGEFYRGLEE